MRSTLGYDATFDTSCYSYELGFANPDPTFFTEAARRIGDEPGAILFIDDSVKNVVGARAPGIAALNWDVEHGHEALFDALASHGVAATQ